MTTKKEQADTATDTRTVRVNASNDKVAAGAAFIHPESKQVIAATPVTVPDDAWTQDMLAQRYLTEK